METSLEPIVESDIDFKLVVDRSVVEYRDRVVDSLREWELTWGEKVDLDDTIASRLSQKEGGDLFVGT